MELTLKMFLIVCPLTFLAGMVDAIGGGGGIISLPAYLIAGLPVHMALGTNKLSACGGATASAYRMAKNKHIDIKLAIPTVIAALIGSSLGAKISLGLDDKLLVYLMLIVLPICAFVVLNKNLFSDNKKERDVSETKKYIIATLVAFVIGIYDGVYGPGTGTFLIIAFTVLVNLSITSANGQAKAINLATNIGALVVFLSNGTVVPLLGLAGTACNMLGAYIGIGLMLKNGAKIVRPSMLLVFILLLIKVFTDM